MYLSIFEPTKSHDIFYIKIFLSFLINSCEKTENGKMKCTWIVDGKKFDGVGQNGQIAKAVAACKALTQLNILTV